MTPLVQFWREQITGVELDVLDLKIRPISKERPRTGKSGHVYTPKKTKDFERAVASACLVDKPVTYPFKISITIEEAPPRTWPVEKRTLALADLIVPSRGDLDNQIKAITDGLNGVAYVDDVQISDIDAQRRYSLVDRIIVSITQTGLSPVQIDHAVASLKAEKITDGQGNADKGGS